ncbi:MAG: hypothetical protein ACYC9Y_16180 [Candidatus Methylomirabilia bacterium]
MNSKRVRYGFASATLLLLLSSACLSRTAAPEYQDFDAAGVPAKVPARSEGKYKVWEFRVVLTNNSSQDLRLRDYDVAIVDTDTGYTSGWNVVPSREILIRAYSTHEYTTDYRTISRFHSGKQRRSYRVGGVNDGTEYRAGFEIELLN